MDDYLQDIYSWIFCDIVGKTSGYEPATFIPCSAGLHELVQKIKDRNGITLNFNEEGKLHSRYLGNRYEPAIIVQRRDISIYHYLFDGEIKDCIHPVSIKIDGSKKYIRYYSSERIKQELPIKIYITKTEFQVFETYNGLELCPFIEGYKHEMVIIDIADYPEQDYTLHDCMEPMSFKFAD